MEMFLIPKKRFRPRKRFFMKKNILICMGINASPEQTKRPAFAGLSAEARFSEAEAEAEAEELNKFFS
jgi:hypothetical protein